MYPITVTKSKIPRDIYADVIPRYYCVIGVDIDADTRNIAVAADNISFKFISRSIPIRSNSFPRSSVHNDAIVAIAQCCCTIRTCADQIAGNHVVVAIGKVDAV